jgi:hypothetical protein
MNLPIDTLFGKGCRVRDTRDDAPGSITDVLQDPGFGHLSVLVVRTDAGAIRNHFAYSHSLELIDA